MPNRIEGISVLIPNYNWDVSTLIQTLHNQLTDSALPFEILCFDDAIDSEFIQINKSCNALPNVNYRVSNQPLGRAQNRNALANAAQYPVLLFLDGDAGIHHNRAFIANYISAFKTGEVVCGGTAYAAQKPDDRHILRYLYGKKKEEIAPAIRQINPWSGFSAFNFLIEKSIFLQIKFNEKLAQYGHEDTLFGNELKYRCITVRHIGNTALHLGLDDGITFLTKTRQAVENLRDLINEGLIDEDVKLFAYYNRAKKTGFAVVLGAMFKKLHAKWEQVLCGAKPNLVLFDLYKLSYLCSLPINHKTAPKAKI